MANSRFSHAAAEGDGISVIAAVDDPDSARAADEAEGDETPLEVVLDLLAAVPEQRDVSLLAGGPPPEV